MSGRLIAEGQQTDPLPTQSALPAHDPLRPICSRSPSGKFQSEPDTLVAALFQGWTSARCRTG